MEQATIPAYVLSTQCPKCGSNYKIYYDLADFYEVRIIKKCRKCKTLYYYSPEDEHYQKMTFTKQINGKTCCKCNENLKDILIDVHKEMLCEDCGWVFSLLDEDLARNTYTYPPDENRKWITAYNIYS